MDESTAAPVPVETAVAPIEAPVIETAAPEPIADLLGSTETPSTIQPDTSNEPWFNQLNEEYRTNPNITKYGSMDEMAKGLINQSALIGKKGIIKPGDNATPEEMGAYFNSLGRPTESTGYEYAPIEGAPDVDQDAMAGFQEFAHKNGYSQEQYQAGIEFDLQRQQNAQAQFEQERADEVNETRNSIYDEMGETEGNAFIRDADAAGKALGLNDVFVEHGIANNVTVIRALAKAAKSIGSSSLIGDHGGSLGFDEQVAAIRANPAYKDNQHPEYNGLQAKMDGLYKNRFPNQ